MGGTNQYGGLPRLPNDRESTFQPGDVGLIIPGSGRSPGEENDNPLQYSCLENPMIRGAGRSAVGSQESDTTERLNHNTSIALCVS